MVEDGLIELTGNLDEIVPTNGNKNIQILFYLRTQVDTLQFARLPRSIHICGLASIPSYRHSLSTLRQATYTSRVAMKVRFSRPVFQYVQTLEFCLI